MVDGSGPRRRVERRAVERLECRAYCSAAVIGTAGGSVAYEYPSAAGVAVRVPLVGRTVYADATGSGTYAAGDPVAVTDLRGNFAVALTAAAEAVRVLPRPGWAATAPGSDGAVASPGGTLAAFTVTMADPTVIDVAVAYTTSATRAYGPSAPAVETTAAALFAYANQVQGDSDTNVRLNLVATTPTAYAESGTFAGDLAALSAGRMADATAAARAAAADLTVLIEGDANRDSGGEIGLSYEFTRGRPVPAQGVAVVSLLGNADRDGVTLAHEFGHLLGADHDPAHAGGGAAAYARGFPFVGSDGTSYQDVMSYGSGTFLPFYSTPAAFYAGSALGRLANGNNARAVQTNGPAVARYVTAGDEGPAAAADSVEVLQSVAVAGPATRPVLGGSRGRVTVKLSNAGAATVAGVATVTLTLTSDTGGADGAAGAADVPVRLRPGGTMSKAVSVTWPADLPAGSYHLVATTAVGDADAIAADGTGPASAVPVAYQPPTIDVAASATAAARVRGGSAVAQVRLANVGNTAAAGTVAFVGSLTPAAAAAAADAVPIPVAIGSVPLAIAAGRARTVALAFPLPAGLPAGAYVLEITAQVTTSPADSNPADKAADLALTVV